MKTSPSNSPYRNGFYPDEMFTRPPRRGSLKAIDWFGAITVSILLGGMFVFAVAVLLGAFWLLLVALDAVVRRLGG